MTEQKMTIPQPLAPHPDTLSEAVNTIQGIGPAGRVLVTYCNRNHCGAVFFMEIDQPHWRMYSPIPIGELIQSCESSGIKLPDGEDLQRWLTAVAPHGPAN